MQKHFPLEIKGWNIRQNEVPAMENERNLERLNGFSVIFVDRVPFISIWA